MFTESDYEKLHQIMAESPEKEELLTRLLHSHRMDISTISHEIRNPLTLIYSTLQMIEASNPEVLNIRHWSDLHSDIEYMKQLLEELSAYNNGQRLSPSSTDFDIFLKKISLSFASSIIETDIEFISRIEPGLPVMPADSIKLREVLLNLLGNARDAVLIQQSTCSNHLDSACNCESNRSLDTSKALTYSPQIHFHAWKEHSNLIISVSDNGCGIAPEHLSFNLRTICHVQIVRNRLRPATFPPNYRSTWWNTDCPLRTRFAGLPAKNYIHPYNSNPLKHF